MLLVICWSAAGLIIAFLTGQLVRCNRVLHDVERLLEYQTGIVDQCLVTMKAQDTTIEQLQIALRPGSLPASDQVAGE